MSPVGRVIDLVIYYGLAEQVFSSRVSCARRGQILINEGYANS